MKTKDSLAPIWSKDPRGPSIDEKLKFQGLNALKNEVNKGGWKEHLTHHSFEEISFNSIINLANI